MYDVVQSYRPTKYLSVGAKGIKVLGGGTDRGGAGSGVFVPQGLGLSVACLLFHVSCFVCGGLMPTATASMTSRPLNPGRKPQALP